jgi:hypothetical protein
LLWPSGRFRSNDGDDGLENRVEAVEFRTSAGVGEAT